MRSSITGNALPFNSRPHEEADDCSASRLYHKTSFNSRPHEEADCLRLTFLAAVSLSTHGLTRRPTRSTKHLRTDTSNFQLTASRGGRRSKAVLLRTILIFQLTASRGGRLFPANHRIYRNSLSTHGLTRRPTIAKEIFEIMRAFQLTASRGGRLVMKLLTLSGS